MDNNTAKGKVMSGLFWVYCETISAQAVTFIVTILLARLLTPSDYGTIALVIVFVNIANVFVTSSFSNALIQKKDATDKDYQSVFWFNVFLSICLFTLLFFIAPLIADYYNIPLLCPVLRILAVKIPLSAYNSIQLAKISHNLDFRKSFISTSVSTFLSGAIGISLAYYGAGVWALVFQVLSNIVLNTIILSSVVKWRPKLLFSYERLLPLLKYGWKLLVTGLMFTSYSELSKLIIGKRYGSDDLGFYDKGVSFPHFIASNVDATITRVLFPTLSNQQDNKKVLELMTRRSSITNAYIMTPILFGLAITAPDIVHLLLTDKWLPCVPYIQIMCFSWFLQPNQSSGIQAIKAIGRSDIYLKVEIISKVIGVFALFFVVYFFNSVLAIAASLVFGQFISFTLYSYYCDRLIGYKIKQQIHDVLCVAGLGLLMLGVIYFCGQFVSNSLLRLTIQIIIGAVSYVFFSWLFKAESLIYIINLIKRKH